MDGRRMAVRLNMASTEGELSLLIGFADVIPPGSSSWKELLLLRLEVHVLLEAHSSSVLLYL